MPLLHLGGSFAPPLDATKLATYRDLGATASPRVREIIDKLADMVELFQQTPRSTLPGRPHQTGRVMEVPLEQTEIDRIFDVVPWDDENEMYHSVAGQVQAAESERNSAKVQAWTISVIQAIHNYYFSTVSLDKLLVAYNALEHTKALIGSLTAEQEERVTDFLATLREYRANIETAISTKKYDSVPYPTNLEDTRLREAIHHLVWWAKELAKDREPITSDQL